MRRLGLAAIACCALSAPGAPASASADGSSARTIRWAGGQVTHVGSLRTTSSRTRSPTLARAIAAFGRPSSRKLRSTESCEVNWGALGLRATFVNLGLAPPGTTTCTPSVGKLQVATIRGRGFRTQRGLHVGDSTARLKALHSGARFRQGSWWLATAPAVMGDVEPGERFPIVRAITQGGKVARFALHIGAAGE